MTRVEIALKWAKGELSDEEVRREMAKTKHPVLRGYNPLKESDSYWDGEEDNTSMAVGTELMLLYCEKMAEEFMDKFWISEPLVIYDDEGNRVR